MANEDFALTAWFKSCGPCAVCGIVVVLPAHLADKKREDHTVYFCGNGHKLVFKGKTELEKTRELLETERRWRERAEELRKQAELQASAARGVVTRMKNRVGNGVCPCCNRTFQNLMRHMQTKHPELKSEK